MNDASGMINGYSIDEHIFSQSFASGCSPAKCEILCCEGGVFVDTEEQKKILTHHELITMYMDESQTNDASIWFGKEAHDADYPSGRCIETRVHNDKCVFLNAKGLCVLQVAGQRSGMGHWGLKPFFCVAFPITIENGILKVDELLSGDAPCCTTQKSNESNAGNVVEVCEEELQYVLGVDGYTNLRLIAADRQGNQSIAHV